MRHARIVVLSAWIVGLWGCGQTGVRTPPPPPADMAAPSAAAGLTPTATSRTAPVTKRVARQSTDVMTTASHSMFARSADMSLRVKPAPMQVHFINVGQAAAAIVEFPGSCGAILIDAGQGPGFSGAVHRHLEDFFESQRPDLNRTLRAIYLTHPHEDHLSALKSIGLQGDINPTYHIDNVVDDGLVRDDAKGYEYVQQDLGIWITAHQGASHHRSIVFEKKAQRGGYTGPAIDPVQCPEVDPEIRVLWGQSRQNVMGSSLEFNDPNNHSLVIRIDYGASSILFTGDLEIPAIEQLLLAYATEPQLLDADVYVVGHHGSINGSTVPLMEAVSPMIAVIQVGDLDDTHQGKTARGHGHPYKGTVEALTEFVKCDRRPEAYAPVSLVTNDATDSDEEGHTISRIAMGCHVYATGWDGDITVSMPYDESDLEVQIGCELPFADAKKAAVLRDHQQCVTPPRD